MVMKIYSKKLVPVILTALLMLCSVNANAGNEQRSGQAGATELLINPWARSSGWGGINTASVQGLEATFMNVAGLAGTVNTELVFSSTSWLFDMQVNAVGFSKSLADDAVLGLAITSIGFGDINITTSEAPEGTGTTYSPTMMNIGLSYAKKFTDNISGGATVRMIAESTPDMKASAISLDAGIQYVAGSDRQIKFGVSLKNVGPKMKYEGDGNGVRLTNTEAHGAEYSQSFEFKSDAFELPSSLNIGGAYDFTIDQDNPSTIREPIIKSPIRTAKPISALLLFFATELVIINTRSVRKNTTNERIFCHWKKSSIAKASATNAIIIASIPIIAPLLLLIRKLK